MKNNKGHYIFKIKLLNVCKDIGLSVNARQTKYKKVGRHRGMMANEHIRIDSNSYEKVTKFKYLGSLLINQILFTMKKM